MKKTIGVVVVFAWVFATQVTAQTVWYKWIQNSKYNDDIQLWITDEWKRGEAYDSARDCRASIPKPGAGRLGDDGTQYLSTEGTVVIKGPPMGMLRMDYKCLPQGDTPR
jgi:hypothetical protein